MSKSERVFIHELVDVIGPNRHHYIEAMSNFAPTSRMERGLRMFGIWGAIGSTTKWPTALNLWESEDWQGMARNFAHETGHQELHDPSLRAWIADAQKYRSGGFDRVLISADFMPSLEELIADPAVLSAKAFHHEIVKTAPGRVGDYLNHARDLCRPAAETHGGRLVGAFRTAMRRDAEAILIWSLPDWPAWGSFQEMLHAPGSPWWGGKGPDLALGYEAFLLCSGPRSPLLTGKIL